MTRFNHIERRVRMIRLAERISRQETYSRKIGLSDESHFYGKRVRIKEN